MGSEMSIESVKAARESCWVMISPETLTVVAAAPRSDAKIAAESSSTSRASRMIPSSVNVVTWTSRRVAWVVPSS